MANEQNLIPFSKDDPRINRNGRPKNFDALRELAKDIGYEPVDIRQDPDARNWIEAILRDWMTSKSFQKQQAFMQCAFGKVPDKIEITQERNRIIVTWMGEEEEPKSEPGYLTGETMNLMGGVDESSSNELDTAQGEGCSSLG